MTRTTVFQTNRSQAVRLPKDVAFPAEVREVTILRDGPRRIIVPADSFGTNSLILRASTFWSANSRQFRSANRFNAARHVGHQFLCSRAARSTDYRRLRHADRRPRPQPRDVVVTGNLVEFSRVEGLRAEDWLANVC
jgi:virulence-associated protein VagC